MPRSVCNDVECTRPWTSYNGIIWGISAVKASRRFSLEG